MDIRYLFQWRMWFITMWGIKLNERKERTNVEKNGTDDRAKKENDLNPVLYRNRNKYIFYTGSEGKL